MLFLYSYIQLWFLDDCKVNVEQRRILHILLILSMDTISRIFQINFKRHFKTSFFLQITPQMSLLGRGSRKCRIITGVFWLPWLPLAALKASGESGELSNRGQGTTWSPPPPVSTERPAPPPEGGERRRGDKWPEARCKPRAGGVARSRHGGATVISGRWVDAR